MERWCINANFKILRKIRGVSKALQFYQTTYKESKQYIDFQRFENLPKGFYNLKLPGFSVLIHPLEADEEVPKTP